MRNPAGVECKHYYEDFNRGRSTQECRLIEANRDSLPWTSAHCSKCQVPQVLALDGARQLRLRLTARKQFGLLNKLDLEVRCRKHDRVLRRPLEGCADCQSGADA